MKQISSLITTDRREPNSSIGTPLGERGLATSRNTEAVAAWLARRDPADTDRAAALRASSHGVGLTVRFESRFPTGRNGERLPSYEVAVGCDVHGSPAAIESALADLRNFMTPAPAREIEGWLAELSVIVARRADDAFAEELRVTAYASRLGRYPADVVRHVLHRMTYKFWPAWEELEKRCEAMTGPRRHMIRALERGPASQEPSRRPATAEERARIQAMVDELFPSHSQAERTAAVDEALRGNCMVTK